MAEPIANILVVDDDPSIVNTTKLLLTDAGYTAHTALNVRAAVQVLPQVP